MIQYRRNPARRRVNDRYSELFALCARAYGAGMCAGVGPDPEAARQLEELLDAPLSDHELADLEVVGWLPTWRRDFVNAILHAREMVGDEFGESDGRDRDATDPDAGPRTLH